MDVGPGEVVGEVAKPVGLLRVDDVDLVCVPPLVEEMSGESVLGVRGTREQVQEARSLACTRGRQVFWLRRRGRVVIVGATNRTGP